jgi:hypothetical protein
MYCAKAQSDVMCSFSRAKRTSLPKATSRPKGTSRSAQAEHIVPKQKALLAKCFLFWRRHPDVEPQFKSGALSKKKKDYQQEKRKC